MSKGKRKRERQDRRKLRVLKGGGEPDAIPGETDLESRPEYQAHMAAWRAAGSPPPR